MGTIIHEIASVTSWCEEHLTQARDFAATLFEENLISEILDSRMNYQQTFFIATSGSKLGREEQEKHTENLRRFTDWLSQSDLYCDFVWLEYGSELATSPQIKAYGK